MNPVWRWLGPSHWECPTWRIVYSCTLSANSLESLLGAERCIHALLKKMVCYYALIVQYMLVCCILIVIVTFDHLHSIHDNQCLTHHTSMLNLKCKVTNVRHNLFQSCLSGNTNTGSALPGYKFLWWNASSVIKVIFDLNRLFLAILWSFCSSSCSSAN